MYSTFMRLLAAILIGWHCLASAQNPASPPTGQNHAAGISRGSVVRLKDGTPLIFQQRSIRVSRPRDEFVVLEARAGEQMLYLSLIEKGGVEFAASAPSSAAILVDQSDAEIGKRVVTAIEGNQYAAALALLEKWQAIPAKREDIAAAITRLKLAEGNLAASTKATAAVEAEGKRNLRHADLTAGRGDNPPFVRAAEAIRKQAQNDLARANAKQKEVQSSRDSAFAALQTSLGLGNVEKSPAPNGATIEYLNDPAVIPEGIKAEESEPTYLTTVEFINGKLKGAGQKLWFGKNTKKMILSDRYGTVVVFDLAAANPAVKYTTASQSSRFWVRVSTSDARNAFRVVTPGRTKLILKDVSEFDLLCADAIDTEKVAKAMRHLIEMFGGKEEPF